MGIETVARTGQVLAKWLWYVPLAVSIGVAAFDLVARSRSSEDPRFPGALARLGLFAALALPPVLVLRLAAQTYATFGIDEPLHYEHFVSLVVDTPWGRGWLWQLVASLLALIAAWARLLAPAFTMPARIAAPVLAMTAPLTGHAQASATYLALQAAHVLAAGLWLGALAALVVAERRGLLALRLAEVVKRFSPMALASATLLAATGAATATGYVASWRALVETGYGLTLSLKLLVVAGVALVGAINWRRVAPQLDRPEGQRTFRRTGVIELALGALVLGVTAWLVELPRPIDLE